MRLTNNFDISLPLAVWLLHDDYDHVNEPNYLSATTLLKPTKQLILSRRVEKSDMEIDLSSFVASRVGSAVHDSIEKAWRITGPTAMKRLGYPEQITERLVVNPTDEQLQARNDIIPIWFEQRSIREIAGYKIGGKFDVVIEGRLFDFKSTSVWTYLKGSKDQDYALQGSIYRWLNPHLITDDHIFIQFLFTDWQRREAKTNPNYPKAKVLEHPIKLLSLVETEHFITAKLHELSRLWNAPEAELPPCSDKDLWRSDPQFKYYADPAKTMGRSTRTFDNMADAQAFMSEKAGKGVVKTVPGEVKACEYCPAFSICRQKDEYYVGAI